MNEKTFITKLTMLFEKLDYTPRNLKLFIEALTHPSLITASKNANAHQRLEFLGDSIINFFVTNYIFNKAPTFNEGQMTLIRAAIVSTISLAKISIQLNLGEIIQVGPSMKGADYSNKMLADVFEAFVGAIYLDNIETKKSSPRFALFINKFFTEYIFKKVDELMETDNKNPKTILQEFLQADKNIGVKYKIKNIKDGFSAEVVLSNQSLGYGEGKNKKAAETLAAKDALTKLKLSKKVVDEVN